MPLPLRLRHPVTVADVTVTELVFRDSATAGDLRGVKLRDLEMPENLLRVAGRLCGQPDPIMHALSIPDFVRVAEVVGGFFEVGPTIGIEPSP